MLAEPSPAVKVRPGLGPGPFVGPSSYGGCRTAAFTWP
jgi:hypothetical protein